MNRLNAILEDPSLEEHFIYYVGLRHMHQHWELFLDPALPYEWDILELYYKEMRRGTFEDLKLALRKSHRITSADPDFQQLVEQAIEVIVDRHGMDEIVASAREFLHEITADITNKNGKEVDFSAPVHHCPKCNKVSISLTYEDLPLRMLEKGKVFMGDRFGFCIPCEHIFPATAE